MKTFDDYRPLAPAGSRTGCRFSKEEIHARRLAIATAVLVASINGRAIRQNRDLAALPECLGLVGRNGIGDFVGGRKHGLQLEKHLVPGSPRDYEIPPGAWQSFKCWDWLRTHAADHLETVAQAAGFDSAAEAEAEVVGRVDAEVQGAKQVESSTAAPTEPDDRTELLPGEIPDDEQGEFV